MEDLYSHHASLPHLQKFMLCLQPRPYQVGGLVREDSSVSQDSTGLEIITESVGTPHTSGQAGKGRSYCTGGISNPGTQKELLLLHNRYREDYS